MRLRLKIALLSLLISGTIVVGFAVYFLGVVSRVQINCIDREISAQGNIPLRRWLPQVFWEDFGKSLQTIYGDEESAQLVACVWDSNHNILYKPAHCPREIAEIAFPNLEFAEPPQPEPSTPYDSGMPPMNPREAGSNDFPGPAWLNGAEMQLPGMQGMSGLFVGLGMRRSPPLARMKKPVFRTVKISGGDWRVGILGNDTTTMVIGVNLAEYHRDIDHVRYAFLVIVPLGLLALAAGGWLLASRALRPITLITRTAAGITARGLDKRVPVTSIDPDLACLSGVINGMLDRLEKSFQQAVRFSADAAHELQTPLTVLQGELEEAIQRAVMGSDEQGRYSDLLEETQGLKAIVQKLLLLARADAGQLTLSAEDVDLTSLLDNAVEDVRIIAPQLQVEQRIPTGVRVRGDAVLLAQAIRNMTSNAIKYNADHGLVSFELQTTGQVAQFILSNTGAPIPDEDRERIFDRFYRVDKSRSRRIGGVGLGLSLTREIARAHHGDLVLNSTNNDLISFTLTVPLANGAAPV